MSEGRLAVGSTSTSIVQELAQVNHRGVASPGTLLGQEIERKRIARELHDDICQRLVLLSVSMSAIAQAADVPPALRDEVSRARTEVERLGRDVHCISHNLHPSAVAHVGVIGAVRQLCDDFSRRMSVRVAFSTDDAVQPGSADVELALYRVTQEALSNVARHSRSASATVALLQKDGALQLIISDAGVGFDQTQRQSSDGIGLASIREWASVLDASLEVRSVPSLGTTIELRVPVRHPNAVDP